MGRGRHYKRNTEERIVRLLRGYRSLPQAVRELGGRPSERTCRRWIAHGGSFAKEYRQLHCLWQVFRISRGLARSYGQLGLTGAKARAHFQTMRELEAELRGGAG